MAHGLSLNRKHRFYNYETKSDWNLATTARRRYEFSRFLSHSKDETCLAEDERSQSTAVIKRISRESLEANKNQDLVKLLREIQILSHVKNYNLVELWDAFMNGMSADKKLGDVYVVTNQFPNNLSEVFKSQQLEMDQVTFLTYQIFRGLKYLHSCNIIHRDLKPSNIFVNENLELKVGGIFDD